MPRIEVPPSYLTRLMDDLDAIERDFLDVLHRSAVSRSTLNDGNGGMVFFGLPSHNWAPSPPVLERTG